MVGYSDHSIGNEAAITSVALGSVVIEKHFTTNRLLPGPDQKTSITPKELTKIIDDIHSTKEILGDYKKECQKEEMEMRKISRKSLTLNRNIRKNQKIKRNYLTLKRPGSGILFTNIKKILGKRAKRHLKKDHQPKLNDLKK
jgi:sialic acid synthase SpsE